MNPDPLVSVVIPVYNAERYLEEALRSVFSQTHKKIEVICIDDASRDGSLKLLRAYGEKIRLLENEKNLGIGETRNRGIAIAKGEYLAFMDADDIWLPQKLETQINQFVNDPKIDVSFSFMKCFISPDLSDEIKDTRYCPPLPMPGYISGTAVIKTNSFKSVGTFDPRWKVGEFVDWLAKAKEKGLVLGIVPGIFLLRRIHASNTGVTERPSRSDYLKIVKESLDRKKQK